MIIRSHQGRATPHSNHTVTGEAMSSVDGARTVSDMTQIHKCLETILAAFP